MAVPVSELQTPNIDNIVELFQLELNTTIHGVSQTYYFHNGVGANNDANIICFPARFVSLESVLKMIDVYMKKSFEGGRHLNRVNKIDI